MQISLRAKWALALALTSLLPLTALSYRTQAIQRASLAETERALEGAVVRQASSALSDELDRVASATLRVASLISDARVSDPELRLTLARDVVSAEARLERLAVYTADGALVFSAGVAGGDPAPERMSQQSITNDAGWSVEHRSASSRFFYLAHVERAGKLTGHVVSWVDASFLQSRLETLSLEHFDSARRLALVDQKMRLIAGQLPSDTVTAAVRASGIHADVSDKPVEVTRSFSDRGVATVGTVLPLPDFAAVLVTARPESEAFISLGKARREFAVTLGVSAVVALALAWFLASSTTKPIARLVELCRAYGSRNFQERAQVRTGDELEALGHSLEEMADGLQASELEIERRAHVEAGLSRYMPEAVASAIARGETEVQLGGVRKDISVLFADVVGFTSFAEGAPPEQVSALLNELFGLLSETVFRHGGVVDKFMGDCVMALFGATHDTGDHPSAALACAEDMHRFVEAQRDSWKERYGFQVRLGIGCATGAAVVGNLGSERRLEFTAVGDPVNVASRLESLARPGQTLCTSDTAMRAPGFPTRSRGLHPLRGKSEAIEVFELEEEP